MAVFRRAYRYVRHVALQDMKRTHDVRSAKQRLLSSGNLTDEEKCLLDKVSLQIHRADQMYVPGEALNYLSVGLSASRCIHGALRSSRKGGAVGAILDFPCGYGRVLRFLRVMFPNSDIIGGEIETAALEFCRRAFSATALLSSINLSDLSLPQRFDLIWCGSLMTHIDEQATIDLLRFFHDHLADQGLCIFTTHGQRSIERIQSKKTTYGLTEEAQHKVLRDFQAKGYGYADYPNQSGYGISTVSRSRIVELARGVGMWHEVFFVEHGWDDHQDACAFAMQMPNKGMESDK